LLKTVTVCYTKRR